MDVIEIIQGRAPRDPDDDTILEYAAAARSDDVVTGDKDLLEAGLHLSTRIIMPAVFLALGPAISHPRNVLNVD